VTENQSESLANFELSRDEGIQTILTLINLIPDPAVIYHRGRDEIITANNPLFLITTLGEAEFIGKQITSLLPDITDTDPISGHNKQALLRHKKQTPIPVNIRIFTLNQSQDTLLLIFQPETIHQSVNQTNETQSDLFEGLLTMMQIRNDQDISSTLRLILQKSSEILDADITCIYKASGTQPQLNLYVSNDQVHSEDLPNLLTSEDLANSQKPSLWCYNDPTNSYLQKIAASADYQFLITIPLGEESAKFGLFVAAGMERNTNTDILALAKLIAAYLSGLMQDQIALSNLRSLANKIKQVVKIQNEIIANLDEGVLILSPDLTIAEINPAAETILGYANVEAVRQQIDAVLIGSESLVSALTSAQQGIPTITGGDLKLHHRNGKSFPAQVMISPVMSGSTLLSIIILIRDISEEEQSQAARKQLEQRAILGEVTAIFAHEVRNPINAIMLSLQVIEDNLNENDENHKWIENIREECNKLLYLMESVLSFAKPLEYRMSNVNLDDMLPRILERWHPRLLRLYIDSYYESSVQLPIVEGDPRALEQVFTNLISNSVNAMSDNGGSLGIKISESDHEEDRKFLEITLTDSGHGIPDEIKSHMFKPFVTGSNRGTGLGLAITQRIINAHKGKIEVDSFAGGTIFRIFLIKSKGNSPQ